MIARRMFIEGKVQGVFFREWTVRKANELGVSGWVRNRRDGRVEVYALGGAALLDRFMVDLRRGSPGSRVDTLSSEETDVEPIQGFTRRETV